MKKLLLASAMTLAMVSVAYAQGAATPAAPAAPTVNGAMGKPMPMGGAGDMGKPMAGLAEMEKCYGVAKAGKNDCATAAHSCAGNSKTDGEAWLNTPKGLCDKIVGGSTKPKA